MFKNDNQNGSETIIGPSVKVEGDFISQGNIQVEGSVSGTINTKGNLQAGEQSRINANIEATSAYIAGYVKGNITIHDRLELAPTSQINGDILAKILVVAEGAKLNGRCQMGEVTSNNISVSAKGHKKITPSAVEISEEKS